MSSPRSSSAASRSKADPLPVPSNDFKALWDCIRADAMAAFQRVGESGWFILGREVAAFEAALAQAWPVPHAVGCGNGLDAIEIGLTCLALPRGTPVLTTPLSAFATTLAIVRAGGVPWFVDVDESGLIDLDAVESALHAHPELRWLVPVHLYGHALDLRRLAELMARFELRVVEDCAQSIGARSRGTPTGRVGEIAATSFYPTKNLGCLGDGGALLTGSAELANRARSLRDYGQTKKYEHALLGLNSRLDEVQAAVMRDALLPRVADWTARRRAIARRYRDGLRSSPVEVPPVPEGSDSACHLFPVLVDDPEGLLRHLGARGVGGARHYPICIPDQAAMRGVPSRTIGTLERARRFAAREVSLPIHPFLDDEGVDRVIEACRAFTR